MPTFTFKPPMNRRSFLKASGVMMALPWLDAMTPALRAAMRPCPPQRFVSISNGLGFHAPYLFPTRSGRDYETTRYLKPINDLRSQFTIISGVSHPGVGRGHLSEPSILSAAPPTGTNFRNTISLDQYMAQRLGGETRFPSLVMNAAGDSSSSYTENGAMIPPVNSPQHLFNLLFVDDHPAAQARQARRMRQGRSIMDLVASEARTMQRNLGAGDRDKLDDYLTSVRELEKRLSMNESWANRPKPQIRETPPDPIADANDLIAHQAALHDIIHLALRTDSTRFLTLHTNDGGTRIPIDGVDEAYHSLSHHGLDENKIAQLALIEEAQMTAWGNLIRRLHETPEEEGTLLDHSMILLTSNLGNASSHDTRNMPVVMAGGGFRHGQHLAFDRENNYPLPNLFVSMIQRLGIESDQFASSTGTMRGLDLG